LAATGEGGARALARRAVLPLVACGSVAAIFGLPHLERFRATTRLAYVADPSQCEIRAAPGWFCGDVEAGLRDALAALPPQTLRDDAAVDEYAGRIAAASGWILSIRRAEKRYPNRLEIEAALRRPIALVDGGDGLLLLAGDGVVVDRASGAAPYLQGRDLPLIYRGEPLSCRPGQTVRASEVLAGLAVAQELAPYAETLRARDLAVKVIDVRGARDGGGALSEVELLTREGLPIEWGRARSRRGLGALEPSAAEKIRGLLSVAAKRPTLSGIRRIRLQFKPPSVIEEDGSAPEARLAEQVGLSR
jgi:hypothetical protein